MKVEFRDSDMYGLNLYVDGDEFLKAKSNIDELNSLKRAVFAFYSAVNVDYDINSTVYSVIADNVAKGDAVIFVIAYSEYPRKSWCEIYIIKKDNQTVRMYYWQDDGCGLDKGCLKRYREKHVRKR